MVSGGDKDGLRHKPRHKAGEAGRVSADMGLFELKLIGWGVPREHPEVNAIQVRLGKVWRRWSRIERSWYLGVANAIAEAETAKAACNPKAQEPGERQLQRIFALADLLAKNIRLMWPPPLEENDIIRKFLRELELFAEGMRRALKPVEKATSVCVAAEIARRAKRRIVARAGYFNFELLADLAWLASGMRYQITEHAVRRYLEVPFPSMNSTKRAPKKREKH